MPHVFAQLRIPHRNLMAEDAVVNGFHFTGTSSASEMVTEIIGRLYRFYCAVPPGPSNALNTFMSGELNLPGARVKFYDWDDPEPRAPIADESPSLVQGTPVATTNLPGEVALCTSYRGPLVSGALPARRRDRLYIGPLNTGAVSAMGTNSARPSAAFRSTLAAATEELASESTLGCRWVVWSRVNAEATAIEYGWVDDAFDTQRRRGVAATTRTNWSVEIP